MTFISIGLLGPPMSLVLTNPIWLEMTATPDDDDELMLTGTNITLFQLGCLFTQSGSLASPLALLLLSNVMRLLMFEN